MSLKLPSLKISRNLKVRLYITAGIVVLGSVAFTFGVGAASLKSSILASFDTTSGTELNSQVLLSAAPQPNPAKQVTFRVEIIRDGKVLCSAPEIKVRDGNAIYDTTPSSCPPLLDGDNVRAIWSQVNEVKLSYK